MRLTLAPAYGRDYKSKAAVLDDWKSGKDFVVVSIMGGGKYINRADAQDHGIDVVNVRYSRLSKVAVIEV